MLVLGIDTSAGWGVLCLGRGGKVIDIQLLSSYLSSAQILPALDILIKRNSLKAQKLEGIVVSLGPGSFTGLRIGVSLAKSLAYALKIPLAGIPTLEVLALSAPSRGAVCPLLKAYRDEYYGQFYKKSRGGLIELSEPLFLPLSKIIQKREGSAFKKVTFILRDDQIAEEIRGINKPFLILSESSSFTNALIRLGMKEIEGGKTKMPSQLFPLYISSPRFQIKRKINIRQMRKEDIPAVSKIEGLSFPSPWPSSAFLAELKKKGFAYYWVMEYQRQVIGYAGYWKINTEAHLVNLAIHPAFRRKGLGERLLRFLLGHVREEGMNTITLEVRQSNTTARRLYEKLKFKRIAIHPHYYTDTGEDAIVYWKKL